MSYEDDVILISLGCKDLEDTMGHQIRSNSRNYITVTKNVQNRFPLLVHREPVRGPTGEESRTSYVCQLTVTE